MRSVRGDKESSQGAKGSPSGSRSIDSFLIDFFRRIDPDHIVPDEESYSPDRKTQFKAPDHFLFDRRILIERKSLQADEDAVSNRINAVTKEQGEEFILFGEIGINAIFRALNDPEKAKKRFADKALNKFEQCIVQARNKFCEHAKATGIVAASRVVIVSEDGGATVNDGRLVEWHMGQLFLRRSAARDKVGLTDSIIYIRDPAYTIDKDNGHWFKWVTREQITPEQRRDIHFFGSLTYAALATHFDALGEDIAKFGDPKQLLVYVGQKGWRRRNTVG